ASKAISSSKRSWGWTTSRAVPGPVSTTMPRCASWPTASWPSSVGAACRRRWMQWQRRSLQSLFKPSLGLGSTTASSSDAAGGSACPAALVGLPVPLCVRVVQGAACLHLRVHLTPRISLTSTLYVYVYCRDMPTSIRRLPPRAWPDLYPDPGTLRAGLDLTQAEISNITGRDGEHLGALGARRAGYPS